jgi:hypothetical protein
VHNERNSIGGLAVHQQNTLYIRTILAENRFDIFSSNIAEAQRILGAQREKLRSLLGGREKKRKEPI